MYHYTRSKLSKFQTSKAAKMTTYHKKFLVRSRAMWYRHEIRLEGTYLAYFPFSLMIEVPQSAAYHKKLL